MKYSTLFISYSVVVLAVGMILATPGFMFSVDFFVGFFLLFAFVSLFWFLVDLYIDKEANRKHPRDPNGL